MTTPSIEELRQWVECNPETGEIRWLKHRVTGRIGSIAGRSDAYGYSCVGINYHTVKEHRLIWAFHYGRWPIGFIDHINGCRADNRIENLREASPSINLQNQRRPHQDSRTGALGVTATRNGKYRAKLKAGGRYVHLGVFPTVELAREAYVLGKRLHHDGCTI